jgi:hypothetical protein
MQNLYQEIRTDFDYDQQKNNGLHLLLLYPPPHYNLGLVVKKTVPTNFPFKTKEVTTKNETQGQTTIF